MVVKEYLSTSGEDGFDALDSSVTRYVPDFHFGMVEGGKGKMGVEKHMRLTME